MPANCISFSLLHIYGSYNPARIVVLGRVDRVLSLCLGFFFFCLLDLPSDLWGFCEIRYRGSERVLSLFHLPLPYFSADSFSPIRVVGPVLRLLACDV